MIENIPVIVEFEGKEPLKGKLIAFSTEGDSDSHIPVGVVLTEDGDFESVPVNFIKEQKYL